MAGNAVYSGSCQSHLLKLRSQAVRIALTLHLAQRANREQDCAAGEYVPFETMKMAVGICEQLIPHITYFWSGVIGAEDRILDKELQKICELIACFHMESPTFGIAKIASSYRDWWPKKSGAQKAHLLAALQDMNWIRPNPKGTMQSPGVLTSYMLHPALRRMFDRHPHIIQERARRRAVVAHFAEPSPDSENPEVS